MLHKLALMAGAALMLTACADIPLGQIQDHQPDPAKKGAPWPTCAPRESPTCMGQ